MCLLHPPGHPKTDKREPLSYWMDVQADLNFCWLLYIGLIIGIKHGFSCINNRQVPWEVLKAEAEGRGFQDLSRDLANVNASKKHVRSLLLHKN